MQGLWTDSRTASGSIAARHTPTKHLAYGARDGRAASAACVLRTNVVAPIRRWSIVLPGVDCCYLPNTLPWRPAIVLLRVLVAVVGVYTNSSPPPSTAISRCYANGADSPTNTNPKVLAVGGRVGSHVDLIVFMRSDGSVVSCACVWHML